MTLRRRVRYARSMYETARWGMGRGWWWSITAAVLLTIHPMHEVKL